MSNIEVVTDALRSTRKRNQMNGKLILGRPEKQKYGSMVSFDMTGIVNFFLWISIRNPLNRGI